MPLALLASLIIVVDVGAQFQQIVSLEYARPLERATRMIEARCDCVITYEDPPYDASQVVDVTSGVRKDGKPEPRVWSPRPSFFSFQYDVTAAKVGRHEIARNLDMAIAEFNKTRADGVGFRLAQRLDTFQVIPAQGSILRTRVGIGLKQGTAAEVIQGILVEVSRQYAKPIELAGMERLLAKHPVKLSADSGNADELILNIIHSMYAKASWKLLFDYAEQDYVLNITDASKVPNQILHHR
ncbi:MAG TPA: hypothetical protein VJM31_07570 [Vicinamibacterales bacterium]|nr:hypothetical protein [Vicinamibacterales bacterium]